MPRRLGLIGVSEGAAREFLALKKIFPDSCRMVTHTNDSWLGRPSLVGSAGSIWNEAMVAAFAECDVVVFANDDIYFSEGDLGHLVTAAHRWPEHHVVTCSGIELSNERRAPSLGYACFAMNRIAFDTVGCFDENLFPIYCEDDDYAYRARLAGLGEQNCPATTVYHFGSAAIRTSAELGRQNRITHRRNLEYYRRKWGGLARQEAYQHPFGNPIFDHRIPPERRHAPYGPGYDRADFDIVTV